MLRAAAAAALLGLAAAQCDEEYECEFRAAANGDTAFYDLKPMCDANNPFSVTDSDIPDRVYFFTVCGFTQIDCIPQYAVEHTRGVAVQFFGDPPTPGQQCWNRETSSYANCTRDCEVLGVGPPIISVADPTNVANGVNVTHYGVPSLASDPFACAVDPTTGSTKARSIRLSIMCDPNAGAGVTDYAREYAPCQYEVIMRSQYGCGCQPDCYGRNCGSDGCGGYCGGAGRAGACPYGSSCLADQGVCCKPDCNGRACGDDGCGGSCGTCGANSVCTRYQTCSPTNVSPSPLPVTPPDAYITTTTGSDTSAAFLGGVLTTGTLLLGFTYFVKARAMLA